MLKMAGRLIEGETASDLPAAAIEAMSFEQLHAAMCQLMWWNGLRSVFHRMLETDLTLSEHIVLRTLQHGSLTVAEAAECLDLSQPTASRTVDRLVRDGYVRREEDPDDRRQKRLTLTPDGAKLVSEIEGVFAQSIWALVAALDEEDRERLRVLLARMVSAHVAQKGAPIDPAPCSPSRDRQPRAGSAFVGEERAHPNLV